MKDRVKEYIKNRIKNYSKKTLKKVAKKLLLTKVAPILIIVLIVVLTVFSIIGFFKGEDTVAATRTVQEVQTDGSKKEVTTEVEVEDLVSNLKPNENLQLSDYIREKSVQAGIGKDYYSLDKQLMLQESHITGFFKFQLIIKSIDDDNNLEYYKKDIDDIINNKLQSTFTYTEAKIKRVITTKTVKNTSPDGNNETNNTETSLNSPAVGKLPTAGSTPDNQKGDTTEEVTTTTEEVPITLLTKADTMYGSFTYTYVEETVTTTSGNTTTAETRPRLKIKTQTGKKYDKLRAAIKKEAGYSDSSEAKSIESEEMHNNDTVIVKDSIGTIYVGDSRTEGMKSNQDIQNGLGDCEFFVCKSGSNLTWLKNDAIAQIQDIISKNNFEKWNIVLMMGVNDCSTDKIYDKYKDLYTKQKSGDWKDYNVYITSINPVDEDKCKNSGYDINNKNIEKFNEAISNISGTKYIDTYKLKNQLDYSDDGLHYTDETNKKVYDEVRNNITDSKSKGSKTTEGIVNNSIVITNSEDTNDEIENYVGLIVCNGKKDDNVWEWVLSEDGFCETTLTTSGTNGDLLGVPAELMPYINEASSRTGIPNWLIAGFMKQENDAFDIHEEYRGAYGLMQFQHYEESNGEDIFADILSRAKMGDFLREAGYSYSTPDELWNVFLNDGKLQILVGAYEIRYYLIYYLSAKGECSRDFSSGEATTLVNWNAAEGDETLRETIRRTAYLYNHGEGSGINQDLDNATFNYPNKVYQYAMEFRRTAMTTGACGASNEVIQNAINKGLSVVGIATYGGCTKKLGVEGDGRCPEAIAKLCFDCSSFVRWCYAEAGADIGMGSCTWSQVASAKDHVAGFAYVDVSGPNDYQVGDLIYFGNCTHVGIWLGNGQMMHCSSTKQKVITTDYYNYVTYAKQADSYVVRYVGN